MREIDYLELLKEMLEVCKEVRKWMSFQGLGLGNILYRRIVKLEENIEKICSKIEKNSKKKEE